MKGKHLYFWHAGHVGCFPIVAAFSTQLGHMYNIVQSEVSGCHLDYRSY